MHLLVGLLALAVIGFLFYRFVLLPSRRPPATQPGPRSDRPFAFLSNGFIFYRERGAAVQQLHSAYAQEAMDRRERSREKHSWKKDTAFGIAAGGRARSFEAADKPLLATSAAFDAAGNLLYFLRDDSVGGLFRREAGSGRELRLMIKQNLHLADLALAPGGATLAATSQQSTGVAHIALMDAEGNGLREVTGGDSVDSAPAWIPDAPQRLLFQSCGLARDEQGFIVAQGPASVQLLNMESGSVSPVLENPRWDYLKPRVHASGDLLFIRRPYEAPRYNANNLVLDTLLFPFRLLRAVFHYLNFFSLMYSRKPLTSASGPQVQADLKDILLQGRRIDAQKALRTMRTVQGVPSLVPDSWELVRRDRDGNERVLATNVASYDVSADGAIVYTNGQGVFMIEPDGSAALALRDQLVGDVVAAA